MHPELTSAITAVMPFSIPSPSEGVWHLGPLPIRGYALCIIAGIIASIWIGEKRWIARGGRPGDVQDLAIWAVPFGLVGGRLYHVATDAGRYFGEGQNPITALYVWRGGLGIWGAIALGAVGAWIACRRRGIKVAPMLDALAPACLVGQALGRWGNWFNQELYGKPTTLPWGLEIDPSHWPADKLTEFTVGTTFHPTFLYEFLWDLAAFAVVIWLDRRYKLGHGRVVAAYVMAYTLGRGWIEDLRIDDVELQHVLGLRFNVWTSIVLFVLAAAYFVWSSKRHPGREEEVYVDGRGPDDASPSDDPDSDAKRETGSKTGSKTGSTSGSDPEAADADDDPADDPGEESEEKPGKQPEKTSAKRGRVPEDDR